MGKLYSVNMVILLSIFILVSSIVAEANSDLSGQIEFKPAKHIMMSGASCQELEVYANDIFNWAQLFGGTEEKQFPKCYCSGDDCQMDVAQISPSFVRELTEFSNDWSPATVYNGPNCFNASLVSASTLPNINFTHPYEMTEILKSSLCQERSISEKARHGDILVVRDQSNPYFEVHAGIYINEELSFSKYGESNYMAYSYGLNVAKAYGVADESCLRIEGIPSPGEACYQKPFVNIYSCRTYYSFVSQILNQPEGIHPIVQQVYAKTSLLDKQISDIAWKGTAVNAESLGARQKSLKELFQQCVRYKKNDLINPQNKELLRLLRFRLFSLFEQTRRIAIDKGYIDIADEKLIEDDN